MAFNFHLPLNDIDTINQPPLYFLQVQDGLILLTGILWSTAYVLYIRQAYRDKSYGMPLIALSANIGWEFIYGVFYPLSFAETLTFIPWLIIDAIIVLTTTKFGPQQLKLAPLIATNLSWILAGGVVMMTLLHWAFIKTINNVDDAAFWSGFLCQTLLGWSSVAQLMSRDNISGHSLTIWLCRWIGTLSAVIMFTWRYAHYPKNYSSVGAPLGVFIFVLAELADLSYIFVFLSLQRKENKKYR